MKHIKDYINEDLLSKWHQVEDVEYKAGDWVAVKYKKTIEVDKVVKQMPSGKVKCEKFGIFNREDIRLMKPANPLKNWNYVDKYGHNDSTGVGIEVGDHVFLRGTNVATGLVEAIIEEVDYAYGPRIARNSWLAGKYICIIRSQEECEKQFGK